MVKKKHLPTPLIPPEERAPVAIRDTPGGHRHRTFQIITGFVGLLIRNFFLRLIGRLDAQEKAVRTRELLESLGFMWIKAGQLISVRDDLLSPQMCRELSKLQFQAVGYPWEQARAVLEEELGGSLERFFAEFETQPFAAASICQVHRARLRRGGETVAVKIQRPDVAKMFRRDMRFIRGFIRLLLRLRIRTYLRWDELLWELDQVFTEETDYLYEASHLKRMRKVVRDHARVYTPRAYEPYCTRRVLTMEYIDGVLMSDYLTVAREDPDRLAAWLEANDISPRRVGRRLFSTFFRQLVIDNFFHGDLHPGNVLLLRGDRVALIDLGTVGSLEGEVLRRYMLYLKAIAAREFELAADLTLMLCPELPVLNIKRVKQEMIRCYRSWEARASLSSLPYREKSFSSVGEELSQVMIQHKVVGSWAFLKIGRTWANLDGSLCKLIPGADYGKIFRREFVDMSPRGLHRQLKAGALKFLDQASTALQEIQLLRPMMREQALAFESQSNKLTRVLTTFFRALSWTTLVVFAGLAWNFLHDHHYALVSALDSKPLRRLANWIPDNQWHVGMMILTVTGGAFFLLRRLVTICAEEEIKLPSD